LYFDSSNEFVSSLVDHWPEHYRTYDQTVGATMWMPTGDSRTGFPFLLNFYEDPHKLRVFVRTDDDEFVSLDMAFPKNGHNSSVPLYFVLHGLNGGSNEEYIRDLTYRRLEEGSTVIVMVARGLMDLPVRG
jgi:predicted alpha/beta-fold hydrolase